MFQASHFNHRKRTNPNPINSYFKKIEKKSEESNIIHCDERVSTEIEDKSSDNDKNVANILDSNNCTFTNDIGLYINKQVNDYTKRQLLEQPWEPPKSYTFPHSVHKKCGKDVKRYLGPQHFEQRKWLVLSDMKKGLFCKYCVLFASEKCGHNKGMVAQNLVTQPLTSFAKLLGKDGHLQSHEETGYHKVCVQAGHDFLKNYHNPETSVVNQVNSQRLVQLKENRERLRPIIESILFLGRQNIPLRGHRDDGPLDEEGGLNNEGNFRELLRFKVSSGDLKLKEHLKTASSRATYISNTTQNQIIECCADEIKETLISNIKKSKFYAVIFDETTDISHTEQLSFNIRYLFNKQIREDLIQFIDAYDNITNLNDDDTKREEQRLTGEALGQIVLKLLQELSLDPNDCVGIGTDSCSVMSSESIGAVTEIQKVAKNAVRCPCMNHCLNNSLSASIKVSCIRNAVGVMKSVISFFNMSAKRNRMLKASLSSLCETRWVERHEAVMKFKANFGDIVEALTSISNWIDNKTSSSASTLLNAICTSEFIVSILSLIDVLKITLPLSRLLQTPSLDGIEAAKAVENTVSTLEKKRLFAESEFDSIFKEAQRLAEETDVSLKLPRLAQKQTKRANYPGSVLDYFRRSVYVPLLDSVINDLKRRLDVNNLKCFGLRGIIPGNLIDLNEEKEENLITNLKKGFKKFSSIIGCQDETTNMYLLEGEIDLWKNIWNEENKKGVKLPEEVLEALDRCNGEMFPTIHSLLQILATLPG